MCKVYLDSTIGKLYKILPLREQNDLTTYAPYVDSLWIEMSGACFTFPVLDEDANYISVLNILAYLNTHDVTVKRCKREVFKAIDLIKKVQTRNGGDPIE